MLAWARLDLANLRLPFRMHKIGLVYPHRLKLLLGRFDLLLKRRPMLVYVALEGFQFLKNPDISAHPKDRT